MPINRKLPILSFYSCQVVEAPRRDMQGVSHTMEVKCITNGFKYHCASFSRGIMIICRVYVVQTWQPGFHVLVIFPIHPIIQINIFSLKNALLFDEFKFHSVIFIRIPENVNTVTRHRCGYRLSLSKRINKMCTYILKPHLLELLVKLVESCGGHSMQWMELGCTHWISEKLIELPLEESLGRLTCPLIFDGCSWTLRLLSTSVRLYV